MKDINIRYDAFFGLMPNAWVPLIAESEVSETPLRVTVAGEHLVIFRSKSSGLTIMLDRCPHKGVPLSLGKVLKNGDLQCAYHGWQFDPSGTCISAPYCDSLSKINAKTVHFRKAADVIWIFTGENPTAFAPPGLLASKELPFRVEMVEWKAHWTRVMENSLDYAHVAFVHRGSFGAFIPQIGDKLTVTIKMTESGFISVPNGAHYDGSFGIEWVAPNCAIQPFDFMGWRGHEVVVPIDEFRTRVFFIRAILNARGNQTFNFEVEPIEEDRIICESIPSEIPQTSADVNVPYDSAAITFRQWYHTNMRKL